MAQSIDQMVDRVLRDLRDINAVRFKKTDAVRAINEAFSLALIPKILQTREDLLVNIDNGGEPLLVTIPAAGADETSTIVLPTRVGRMITVELYVGGSWLPIPRKQRGPQDISIRRPNSSQAATLDTTWELVGGRNLKLTPGRTSAHVNGCRLKYEVAVPPLLMGTMGAPDDSGFTLPSVIAEATGDLPARYEDDLYVGTKLRITEGAGAGPPVTCADYNGTTLRLDVTPNFASTPDATSRFAMITPFDGQLAAIDDLAIIRACIVLLGTKRNEDTSMYVARYNEGLEEFIDGQLEDITAEAGVIMPVDTVEDLFYT